MGSTSSLENEFDNLWRICSGMDLEKEYRFGPPRRYRFDRAHIPSRVAIELEGGLYGNGRHQRLAGYDADCRKYNLATAMGWRVFRVTRMMLQESPLATLGQILEVITGKTILTSHYFDLEA